jgi:peroxiredoxin
MSQLPIGTPAPDFELTGTNGRVYRLTGALARGPVALVFYKSGCPTCQFTFPYIQKIVAQGMKTPGLTLWGISEDEADETLLFAKQHGITFELLIDEHPYAVSAAYGLEFVPGIFLIDSDGTIRVSEFGFTKAGLNEIAGFEFFKPNDGTPATRPG